MKCASVNIWNKNYVPCLSKTERNWLLFASTSVHPPFWWPLGFFVFFLFFCVLSIMCCPILIALSNAYLYNFIVRAPQYMNCLSSEDGRFGLFIYAHWSLNFKQHRPYCNCSVFENVMAQIHHRIEIQCKMKLKYHRDRILSLLIAITLIGVSSHQPLYFFVPISPQGF